MIVKYQNASENHPQLTVRKLVKLFSIDEFEIQDDLTELQKRIDKLQKEHVQQLEDLPAEQRGEAVADDCEDQPLQGDPLQEDGVVQDFIW